MSLESVFKLSLVMNMVDHLSGPMADVSSRVGADVSKLDALSNTFGNMVKAGAVMQETGSQITGAVLAPVEATFETRRAIGELASLGVKDLETVENAARSFSDQWAGTSKADFISAAYDINLCSVRRIKSCVNKKSNIPGTKITALLGMMIQQRYVYLWTFAERSLPRQVQFPVIGGAVAQVQVNQRLVGYTHRFRLRLKIVDSVSVDVNGDLPL